MRFLLLLAVFLHGAFALAVQVYFPNGLASVFARGKRATVQALFPPGLYPSGGPYLVAVVQVVGAYLLLRKSPRS